MTTGFQSSLWPLVFLLLFAVEMPLLCSVVGLPPLYVAFTRVRGHHPLSAIAVCRSGKFVFCPIALRTLVGFRFAGVGCFQVLLIAVQAKNSPRQSCSGLACTLLNLAAVFSSALNKACMTLSAASLATESMAFSFGKTTSSSCRGHIASYALESLHDALYLRPTSCWTD